MGIFFETRVDEDVEAAWRRATEDVRRGDEVGDDLARLALVRGAPRVQALQWNRLLVALGLIAVLAAGAVGAEWADLTRSSDALWGLTTATFGIVVGLIGGEKASA